MRNLEEVRKDIDAINQEMVRLFLRRMELSEEVVRYKMEHQLPIYDKEREQAIVEAMVKTGDPGHLEAYLRDFLKALMEISKDYQQEVLDGEGP
ncbi:chorismate mutase [Alkalibacter rhizosphaerae]|uniref:Chorismate mutase n=1 Tax=Alkalibacter rhizosphaerae TaxID=2815577 RepID=A0A974XDU4_9FIRM|nr:chorismate mutase [Alkalibacter rhizosphaerae]QSX07901.1 chorismate mutase [Alkalibacter rhizosphaerae]